MAGNRGRAAAIQAMVAGSASTYPPPRLSVAQSAWRYVAAFLVSVIARSDIGDAQMAQAQWLLIADPLLGLIAFGLIPLRRRHPLPVAVGAGALAGISSWAAGPSLLILVSLCTRRRWTEISVASAVALAGSALFWAIQPARGTSLLGELALTVVVLAVAVASGMYIGARRDLQAAEADRAEQERARRIEQTRAAERTRIAREMHDVLAHRISRIAMHAGALAYRGDLDPATTRAAVEVIAADAHGALEDLRSVLGVLRDGAPLDAPERPQPTLADVDALVADARGGGMDVRLRRDGAAPANLPDAVGRTAYRILQESLTNAAKHAPGARVLVSLGHQDDSELAIEVRSGLPFGPVNAPPGSGLGLIGLRERAELAGGRLEHGAADGDFLVRAWLPYRAQAAR